MKIWLPAQFMNWAIYELGGTDVSTPDIINYLGSRYGHQYARTTVVTFLERMRNKGYVVSYRKGRMSYNSMTIPFSTYIENSFTNNVEFWLHGNYAKAVLMLWEHMSEDERKYVLEKIKN